MRIFTSLWLLAACSGALAVDLDGHTEFAQRLALNSAVSARVQSIPVVAGQQVSAGQLLLILESTELQANVDIARAEYDALAPEVEKMLTERDKAQELYDRDSLALVELQTAEQNHAIAAAQITAAAARLKRAQFRLSQTQLQAPIDGIVVEIAAFPGQYINTQVGDTVLLTLADNRKMIATGLLPLEHWQASLLGRKAWVSFKNKRYPGKVIRLGQQVTSGGNNHPAATLVIQFDSDGLLPAGLPVKITVADE